MSEQFTAPPPPGEGIQLNDHMGALLLVEVLAYEDKITTSLGDKDAIRADVHVLAGAGAPHTYEDTLLFPKVLVGQLKRSIGKKVLGRLGQGNAKPGQSAPWMLNAAAPEDNTTAETFMRNRTTPVLSSPAPAQSGLPPF